MARLRRTREMERNTSPTLGAALIGWEPWGEFGRIPVYADRVMIVRTLTSVGGTRAARKYARKKARRAKGLR